MTNAISTRMLLTGALAHLLWLSACSSQDPRASFRSQRSVAGGSEIGARSVSVEVENSEQESLKAIKTQPLEFELQFPEATYAWDRARTFFLQYTGSFAVEPLPQTGKPDSLAMLVSNRVSAEDAFIFEVRRVTGKKGAKFTISAQRRLNSQPSGSTGGAASKDARLQAQNLARFIKSGTLDAGITPSRNSPSRNSPSRIS